MPPPLPGTSQPHKFRTVTFCALPQAFDAGTTRSTVPQLIPAMHDAPLRLVLSSFPDDASAQLTARTVIAEKLAACVQLVPGITSVYHWENGIHSSQEVLAICKCPASTAAALADRILQLHPYEVPEIVTTPINATGPYLAWALASCQP